MNQDVAAAIEELHKAFAPSEITVSEDGQGGAYVIVETVAIGERFQPSVSWLGGHIPALYPAADIYPVFMDASVKRADGIEFQAPVTRGHNFQGRPAIQISRRNNQVHLAPQTAVAKFAKILHFLGALP
jgi:hypothetical protein